jgi:hypothetical protein
MEVRMKKVRVLCLVLLAVLLSVTPAFAATTLTRYHSNSSFNSPVGAWFVAYYPCEADWSSWGVTSYYKEIIENWDDCEQGPESRTCWVWCAGAWTQVSCP